MNVARFLFVYFLSLCVVACGGEQNTHIEHKASSESQTYTVTGVATKGALSNATINAWYLDEKGNKLSDAPFTTTLTQEDGSFSLNLAPSERIILLESAGGIYIDESDNEPDITKKRQIQLLQNESLMSLLLPGKTHCAITVLTTAVTKKVYRETIGNVFIDTFEHNLTNAKLALGFDPFYQLPSDIIQPSVNDSLESKQHALVLGGLANVINNASVSAGFSHTTYDIIVAIITDLSDGALNGLSHLEAIEIFDIQQEIQQLKSTIDINSEIERFRNNNYLAYQDVDLPFFDEQQLSQSIQLNQAPTIEISDTFTFTAGESVTITPIVRDPDSDDITINWQQLAGINVEFSTQQFSLSFITPNVETESQLSFQITAFDTYQAQHERVITINILPSSNINPTVDAGEDFSSSGGSDVSLVGSAIDEDGEIISVLWQQIGGDSVTLIDESNLTSRFTAPNTSTTKTLTFRLTATDNNNASSSDEVNVTITPNIGTLNVDAGVDQTVESNTSITLSGSANDSSYQITSYLWQQVSGIPVSINAPSNLVTTFLAPQTNKTETLVFSLTVENENNESVTDNVSIFVKPPASLSIDAGSDQNVEANEKVTLSGTVVASTSDIVSYLWQQTNGPSVTINSPSTLTSSFIAPDVTSETLLSFTLTVINADDITQTDSISVTVTPPNQPPTVDAGDAQTVEALSNVQLIGTATDSDGSITDILWTQVSGTQVELSTDTELQTSFTAPNSVQEEQLVFKLMVTDDKGVAASDETTVIVQPKVNQPPTANAGQDITVISGRLVTLTGSGTDEDGSISSYLWTQVSGPSITIDDTTSPSISFSAPDVSTSQEILLELTVKDDLDAASSDSVVITVTPANPGDVVWQYSTGGPIKSSIGIDDFGNLIVGSDDFYIYSITSDGILNWRLPTEGFVRSSPMIIGSNIYVGSNDGALYSVDTSGNLNWKYQTANPIVSSPALLSDNNIFISSLNNLYSISKGGSLVWEFATPTGDTSSAAIANDGDIFVGSGDGYIYGFPNSSNTYPPNHEYLVGSAVTGAPALTSDNLVFIGADDNKLYALDSKARTTLLWSFQTNGRFVASPVIDRDTLYIGNLDGTFYAIDLQTGEEKWRLTVDAQIYTSAAITQKGTIIFADGTGKVFSLNTDGTINWSYLISGSTESSPVIASDGSIYIGSNDGNIYKIIDDNGGLSTTAQWPMFRYNINHTGNISGTGLNN